MIGVSWVDGSTLYKFSCCMSIHFSLRHVSIESSENALSKIDFHQMPEICQIFSWLPELVILKPNLLAHVRS